MGNHASVLNKNFLKASGSTCLLNDANNLTDSSSQNPSFSSLEIAQRTNDRTNQATSTLMPFKVTTNFEEGSGNFVRDHALLKEWVGHTEVEVVAGAILGFLVSLIIHTT